MIAASQQQNLAFVTNGLADAAGRYRRKQVIMSNPLVVVFIAHDVVLSEVAPGLHFDNFERNLAGVR